jgi:hypothetical protein
MGRSCRFMIVRRRHKLSRCYRTFPLVNGSFPSDTVRSVSPAKPGVRPGQDEGERQC